MVFNFIICLIFRLTLVLVYFLNCSKVTVCGNEHESYWVTESFSTECGFKCLILRKCYNIDSESTRKMCGISCNFTNIYLNISDSPYSLYRSFKQWNFSKILLRNLPIDKINLNTVRHVTNAVFSEVAPTPMRGVSTLADFSAKTLILIDLETAVVNDQQFLNVVSGSTVMRNTIPLAHRYGGHQFGYWTEQLGDGRAHLLGEYVNRYGERWELQLKGSGKTPYSRNGDGRAVIRSSVREFLCSEAMHHLGIPTSRAVTLVTSQETVLRDKFYDGHPVEEKIAVVLRIAKSWFRFGSLEILSMEKEINILKELVDFIIKHHFNFVDINDVNKYLIFFSQVVEATAKLIAQWQSVGFAHGVCNTDNFSIISITIDYGPFRFMDEYDPNMVPNTSDDEHRYSYKNQPSVAKFNLEKLRLALFPLLTYEQQKISKQIIDGYDNLFKEEYYKIMKRKLGLYGTDSADKFIIEDLLDMMADVEADYTMTFRQLGDWTLEDIFQGLIKPEFWALAKLVSHYKFHIWRNLYSTRLKSMAWESYYRRQLMHSVNPRYVLRNWIAEGVIKDVEKGDFTLLRKVKSILQYPYRYQEEAEILGLADPPPIWASDIKVSCSS